MADVTRYVTEVLREAALSYGVKRLAGQMNASRTVLYNKLNPNPSTPHKATLADFINICQLSGATAPMQALAQELGGVFYRLPNLSLLGDDALLDMVNRVHAEGGDVFRVLSAALADGRIDRADLRRWQPEVQDWLAAILELSARVQGMADVVH